MAACLAACWAAEELLSSWQSPPPLELGVDDDMLGDEKSGCPLEKKLLPAELLAGGGGGDDRLALGDGDSSFETKQKTKKDGHKFQ